MRVPLSWLKEFVSVRLAPESLAHQITMGGVEVESIEQCCGDSVFVLGITPNRADCLSVRGVAREVSAVLNLPLKKISQKVAPGVGNIAERVKISVKDPALCPRYCARVIDGVKIAPSPKWLADRIEALGLRSINNVVDATNFVMMECGQPLHAFDLDHVAGNRIIVRTADDGQQFQTLDGADRKLVATDLVIADAKGPVALAGVMGGKNSEVNDGTKTLLLESAYFAPSQVRRTARRLAIQSDSSYRFERGVDPSETLSALHRLTEIIVATAGGKPTKDWFDIYPKKISPVKISLPNMEVERILGVKYKPAEISSFLKRLGFGATAAKGGFSVTVPTSRRDIERPIDLIEEIARVGGYDNIPDGMPQLSMAPVCYPKFFTEESAAADSLIADGFSEAVLYAFTSEDKIKNFAQGNKIIRISNPISAEQSAMVPSLIPGLLDGLTVNLGRQRMDSRLFALQRVFAPSADGPHESRMLSAVMMGRRYPDSWERSSEMCDFYDIKGAMDLLLARFSLGRRAAFSCDLPAQFMHPAHSTSISIDGKRIGWVGQLHPETLAPWGIDRDVFAFELDFELLSGLSAQVVHKYKELSRYPFVERDLAILVDVSRTASEIEAAIHESGAKDIERVSVFDLFCGKGIPDGKKSIALTIRFASPERTLTDDEISAAHTKVVAFLEGKIGAKLR